jgi:hypothetical protein
MRCADDILIMRVMHSVCVLKVAHLADDDDDDVAMPVSTRTASAVTQSDLSFAPIGASSSALLD